MARRPTGRRCRLIFQHPEYADWVKNYEQEVARERASSESRWKQRRKMIKNTVSSIEPIPPCTGTIAASSHLQGKNVDSRQIPYYPDFAVDGDLLHSWRPDVKDASPWWQVSFRTPLPIQKVGLLWNGVVAPNYTVLLEIDGKFVTVANSNNAKEVWVEHSFPVARTGAVRVRVNGETHGLNEVRVY